MAAGKSRPRFSIFTVRLRVVSHFLGIITWATLFSTAGSATADRVRFQPRLDSGDGGSQCLRLYEESKIVRGIPPADIRGMLFDTEDLWLLHVMSDQGSQPQGSPQAC